MGDPHGADTSHRGQDVNYLGDGFRAVDGFPVKADGAVVRRRAGTGRGCSGTADDDSVVDGGVLFNEICVTVTPFGRASAIRCTRLTQAMSPCKAVTASCLREHLSADAGNDLQLGHLHLERRRLGVVADYFALHVRRRPGRGERTTPRPKATTSTPAAEPANACWN